MSKADSFSVYGSPRCGYTVRAMKILEAKNIPFQFHNVEAVQDRNKIIQETGHRTIPVIFRNGKFLGGCSDLEKLF